MKRKRSPRLSITLHVAEWKKSLTPPKTSRAPRMVASVTGVVCLSRSQPQMRRRGRTGSRARARRTVRPENASSSSAGRLLRLSEVGEEVERPGDEQPAAVGACLRERLDRIGDGLHV